MGCDPIVIGNRTIPCHPGTLEGHLTAGTAFMCWAVIMLLQVLLRIRHNARHASRWRPELCNHSIVYWRILGFGKQFCSFGVVLETINPLIGNGHLYPFKRDMNNIYHATIYGFFLLTGWVDLYTTGGLYPASRPGAPSGGLVGFFRRLFCWDLPEARVRSYNAGLRRDARVFLTGLAMFVEAAMFLVHSYGQPGLESKMHVFLSLVELTCSLSLFAELLWPSAVLISYATPTLLLNQAIWYWQIGWAIFGTDLTLWPDFDDPGPHMVGKLLLVLCWQFMASVLLVLLAHHVATTYFRVTNKTVGGAANGRAEYVPLRPMTKDDHQAAGRADGEADAIDRAVPADDASEDGMNIV